ncbi:TetR/AcrR family transcriptional regulator C-terminal domain-containing protein [Longispora sp. NPDC051575]|uniref:TetR/AcrR family transcriptional regulator C-terminal domain-containing protein n=1 Tax=Longispora sp. NPDC051575 TaxID=3154943 RepID=UPI00341E78FB
MLGDQTRTAELLWGPGPRPSRGPKPGLTLERIVAAAIAIADAEGLAAVSMQRVAGDLDFTKMSLYRYVPGKAELTALMVDAAMGPPPDLDAAGDLDAASAPGVAGALDGGGNPDGAAERDTAGAWDGTHDPDTAPDAWRPRLRAWARALWAAFGRHPWALTATEGVRVPGPNELDWMEAGIAALADTGLTGGEQLDALVTVASHLRGLAHQTMAFPPDRPGATEQQLGTLIGALLAERADRFPALAAAMADAAATGAAPGGQGDALDFGLTRVLDGLAHLIDERRTAGRP